MTGGSIDPTIASYANGLPASAAASADVSRAGVDVVEGQRPKFADETASLLRARLQAAALALSVILAAAFAGTMIAGTYSLWVFRIVILVVIFACWLALRGQRSMSLKQLRVVEVVVFGAVVLQVALMQHALLGRFAAEDDVAGVIGIKYRFMGAWCILILVYGVFMPNTWRRCLSLTLSVALTPYLILWLQRWLAPEVASILADETLGSPLPLPVVAAAVATYGTHIINSARREAFKARQLGQYRLLEKLGSGGMGDVYKAEHVLLKRPCAMKLIHPESDTDAAAIARFETEVKATSKLTHWNTVEIYDYGHTEDGTFYYVMELLPGLSLEELVSRYGALPPGRVIYLLRQVCGALQEAHGAGLIHRDIKPANIFSAQRGGDFDVAKLLDFGLVKERAGAPGSEADTRGGAFSGTPLFMAPEQVSSYEQVDARADIYALGAVGFFLLTGRPVFERKNVVGLLAAHARDQAEAPSAQNPAVPEDLDQVILRCLMKRPEDRYGDAASLRDALDACQSSTDWTAAEAAEWWKEHADDDPSSRSRDQSAEQQPAPIEVTIDMSIGETKP